MEPNAALEIVRRGDVVQIVLNRSDKRNALTRSMLESLLNVLQNLPATTRLLVLAAQGSVFCAGMDLQEMAATAELPDAANIWKSDARLYREVVQTLFLLPFPSLCVVQGPVLAGGVGLVLACDLVLGSTAASFALPEPKRGITASIVLPLLKYRIGAGPAGFLLLSGQAVNSEDSTRLGLIHRLVLSEQLASSQAELESSVRSGAPRAVQETKRQLLAAIPDEIRREWDLAVTLSGEIRGLPEAREGLQAFLEHRVPNWISMADPSNEHGKS
ncbi:MAG: Enoyl-CoA hydratase/isomerase [Planctomycetaceae bacterium]|nr:Enoyl-CoA hydratase/isomerase [Planctomycetaceae bacterium]